MASSPAQSSGIDTRQETRALMAHPLYGSLTTAERLRVFMTSHAFCVWDFQCLLKALQREVTCVSVPWLPTPDPEARRLVNEIVMEEESDIAPGGGHLSHYELYVLAMQRCGADTAPIGALLAALTAGEPWERALASPDLPRGVEAFVRETLTIASSGSAHLIAAAFTYGREEVIPDMFRRVVAQLAEGDPASWSDFRFYLERHIEHDEDAHGPQSRALLRRLCGDDAVKWREAEAVARRALNARIALWDAVFARIEGLPAA